MGGSSSKTENTTTVNQTTNVYQTNLAYFEGSSSSFETLKRPKAEVLNHLQSQAGFIEECAKNTPESGAERDEAIKNHLRRAVHENLKAGFSVEETLKLFTMMNERCGLNIPDSVILDVYTEAFDPENKKRIDDVVKAKDDLAKQNADLTEKVTQLTTRVDEMTTKIATFDEINKKLEEFAAKITALEAANADLQQKVAAIQAQPAPAPAQT
eukprot:TRINITY_DN4625_c0_g1_i2.p1 TRINITY_DN4625_c0_g1~~TRINITY_DN4625_c0_g1_i2.p1  ORF type:complete len:212 (+),score=66.96 TRINITY_DN4625_c0_g1_i2:801-1436(+)